MPEAPLDLTAMRALPEADLSERLGKLHQELWQYRARMKAGALPQHHVIPVVKRQIARIHTILRERQG